jgi:hypothetical protein
MQVSKSKSDRYVPSYGWTYFLSVLAGLGLAGLAVADSAMTLDPIEPSNGMKFGDLTVSPYLDVLYIYDSNYNRSKNGDKAESVTLKPGFDFTYENEGPHKFSGTFWYLFEEYFDKKQTNSDQWREQLQYRYRSPHEVTFRVDQFLGTTTKNSPEGSVGYIDEDRTDYAIQTALRYPISHKNAIELMAGVENCDYKDEFSSDRRAYPFDFDLAHRISEKTDVLLGAGYTIEESKGPIGSFNSKAYRVMTGLGSAMTEKISYRAEIGAEGYEYGNGGSLEWGPYYRMQWAWQASRKWIWRLVGTGKNQSAAEAGNYGPYYNGSLSAAYQMNRRMSLAASTTVQYNEYNKPKRNDQEVVCRLDYTYRLTKYASLRLGTEASQKTSTDAANEYDRYRVDAGVNFRY